MNGSYVFVGTATMTFVGTVASNSLYSFPQISCQRRMYTYRQMYSSLQMYSSRQMYSVDAPRQKTNVQLSTNVQSSTNVPLSSPNRNLCRNPYLAMKNQQRHYFSVLGMKKSKVHSQHLAPD